MSGQVSGRANPWHVAGVPPAYRRNLSHTLKGGVFPAPLAVCTEHGKPIPLGVRVAEAGKSEGCAVMAQIRVAMRMGTHQHYPTGNWADFRERPSWDSGVVAGWCLITRELGSPVWSAGEQEDSRVSNTS